MSLSSKLKYIVLSDIHLAHSRNPTKDVIHNLNMYFGEYLPTSQFVDLDIIFIAGDLFDTLIDLSTVEHHEIQIWLFRLMKFCVKYDIALRILEGTPSHDWKQSRTAETVAKVSNLPIDFKYIATLEIEHFDKYGVDVLYIPDELNTSAGTTLTQVKALMSEKGLISVDMAIMHGMFTFQLGHVPNNERVHLEAEYLSIVRYFISIGHIHTFGTYDRIIGQGSFDRNAHGEEEAKGGVLITLDPKEGNNFIFIENKGAKGFKTVTLRSTDLNKCYKQIDRAVSSMRSGDYVRIKAKKDHPLYNAFDELKLRFPMFIFSKLGEDIDDVKEKQNELDDSLGYTPLNITQENVIPLLMESILPKYQLQLSQIELLTSILEATI